MRFPGASRSRPDALSGSVRPLLTADPAKGESMPRRGLQAKINATLAALVLTVAAAAAVSFGLQRRVDEAAAALHRAESGVVAVLRLSIAVRDAWAHQAHVVILNDTTHVDHYRETAAIMLKAAAKAQSAVGGASAAEPLAAVVVDAHLLDKSFIEDVVPKVGGDRAVVLGPAEDSIRRVERMQARIDEAAARLTREADAAHAAVGAATMQSRAASSAVVFVAIIVALASALSLRRALSAPLRRLESATERLTTGDLATRVDDDIAQRDDELGSLATRFNTMASSLAEREARLLDAERLAAVGRLAAGIAHEINNPLGVILGTARLLEKGVDSEGKRDVTTIVAEVERCKSIVGGLLDLSRPPRLRILDVDAGELCEETVERLASALASADIEVDREGDASLLADGEKLRQVLTNVLLNAAQAGARRIEIHVDGRGADIVRISVRDDGPGVAAEVLPRLFSPFATGRADGTGLGLAVSRAIAVAHGGTLEHVASAQGARFDVTLPRRPPASAAAARVEREGST